METILALAVFFLAGMVKGVLGMGLPTIAVGLLVLLMTPVEAAALLLLPSLVTNLWQLFAGPAIGPLARRLWPMMLCIFCGTLVTVPFLADSASGWVPAALGACLFVYGMLGLGSFRPPQPGRREGIFSLLVGSITGLITGATGVFVIPAVPYLQALGLGKELLIQALGLSFTVSTLALGIGLYFNGGLEFGNIGLSCVMLIPAIAGLQAGQWIRHGLDETMFRRLFFVGLLLLGGHLLVAAML
ncbi:sulfite exporter TauE/SafE family protein [Pseudomonas sp. LRF_L74]|uniref:sulfite exporter TauE/SafE family protein n=1 Tax=Pseudomonas sp. LRF_L74 TaxID=3369422 RepID=UPI003F60193A